MCYWRDHLAKLIMSDFLLLYFTKDLTFTISLYIDLTAVFNVVLKFSINNSNLIILNHSFLI